MQTQSLTAKGILLNPILASLLLISLGPGVAARVPDQRDPFQFNDSTKSGATETPAGVLTGTALAQSSVLNAQAAEAALREGEAAFKRREMDKALAAYKRAYELNPKLYDAALYAGDAEFVKAKNSTDAKFRDDHLDAAGIWFAKAIAIDPDRPTAYQYWGDALDAQGKMLEALSKFVDAIITDPYNKIPYVSLTQWALRHKAQLGHPKIEPPNSTTAANSADGSSNWAAYTTTRAAWLKTEFFKNYPAEKQYRHSLKEEASALSSVAAACARDLQSGKVKTLEPSLTMLVKLAQDGFLEAYVLFARPDQGIARDYTAYRAANREKLKQYWMNVVIIPLK